ncbi:macrophage mannose receptor 1-like isoform X1, partial [Clarias magur]
LCCTRAYIPHRYHFVNENKTWIEAQTYCREKYTDLATVNNMEKMNMLSDTLNKETVIQAWIGLNKQQPSTWRWSFASETLYKDGDTYRNWERNQPDTWHGNEFCVHMQGSGSWNDIECNTSLPFVCFNEIGYILINEKKTWRDAQTYCRKNYIDLSSVRNQTENDIIANMIQYHSWIGLFNDSWTWSDQSNSIFRYWGSNKPSGGLNCAAVNLSDQLYWSDVNCTEILPFICHEKRLILIKQNLTWREALNYCRKNHYDLVSVRTQEMQLWVKEVAQDATTEHVWLGLRYDCNQRIWFWVFGSMICYQDWAQSNNKSNEDCSQEKRSGAVQSGGEQQWIDLPESTRLNFICSTYD